MTDITIAAYTARFRDEVIALALSAWEPVFAGTRDEVPGFVYDNFYPDGWQARQRADMGRLLAQDPGGVWLALREDRVAGFVGIGTHPEDRMGEILILAVAPESQRQGIGTALMTFAERKIRDLGMRMVMVETVGDTGHRPARAA